MADKQFLNVDKITSGASSTGSASGVGNFNELNIQAILSSRGIVNINAIAFFSNGGAGKKVQAPYVTETRPTGRFLGDYASATAAWAANKDGIATVAGDYFWNTTNANQEECTTLNNASTNRRGSQNYLPSEGVAVSSVTSGNTEVLWIFDLTDPLVPLWMAFLGSSSLMWACTSSTATFNEVVLRWDGISLWAARNNGVGECLLNIDFGNDTTILWTTGGTYTCVGKIHQRNSALGYKQLSASGIDSNANGVDYADGYVVFSNDGGVGRIKVEDKTVTKSSGSTQFHTATSHRGRLYAVRRNLNPDVLYDFGIVNSLGASFASVNTYDNTGYPYIGSDDVRGCVGTFEYLTLRHTLGLDMLWLKPYEKANSLVARKGTSFATPPMKKPVAMIGCSTYTGTVDSSGNYVSNFASGIGTWTATGNTIVSWDSVGSRLVIDRNSSLGSATGIATVYDVLTAGYVYFVTLVTDSIPGSLRVTLGGCTVIEESPLGYYTNVGTYAFLIQATTPHFSIQLTNSYGEAKFTSITATRVIQNHAGTTLALTQADQNGHATINGTLTATAEATGAVALLSGWSDSNNLTVPYSSALDVGTGDFSYSLVFKFSANVTEPSVCMLYRGDVTSSGGRVGIVAIDDERIVCTVNGTTVATTISSYNDGLIHTLIFYRESGVCYLEIDGDLVASGANTSDVSNASAILAVGYLPSIANRFWPGSIGLVNASSVAPNAYERRLIHKHMRNLVSNKANLDEVPFRIAPNKALNTIEMIGTLYHQTMRDGVILSSVSHTQGGSVPSIACGAKGEIALGGSTGLRITTPLISLNESDVDEKLTFQEFKFTGNSVLTDFSLEPGWYPISVYEDGVLMESGSTKDYTIQDTGLYWFVRFAVAPGAVTVTILAEKRV